MIKKYIIDGNNLLGKIKNPSLTMGKDNSDKRVRLAFLLDRYYHSKNVKVSVHFDGFMKEAVRMNKIKVIYSDNRIADDMIREEIDHAKNPKTIAVVTSDNSLKEYAKVNSCTPISSEEFADLLYTFENKENGSEDSIIKSIDNEEIKKLFGI